MGHASLISFLSSFFSSSLLASDLFFLLSSAEGVAATSGRSRRASAQLVERSGKEEKKIRGRKNKREKKRVRKSGGIVGEIHEASSIGGGKSNHKIFVGFLCGFEAY